MSWEEVFQPGLRHWREFQDWQDDKILEEAAPDDKDQDINVDLVGMTVTIRNNDAESPDNTSDSESEADGLA